MKFKFIITSNDCMVEQFDRQLAHYGPVECKLDCKLWCVCLFSTVYFRLVKINYVHKAFSCVLTLYKTLPK